MRSKIIDLEQSYRRHSRNLLNIKAQLTPRNYPVDNQVLRQLIRGKNTSEQSMASIKAQLLELYREHEVPLAEWISFKRPALAEHLREQIAHNTMALARTRQRQSNSHMEQRMALREEEEELLAAIKADEQTLDHLMRHGKKMDHAS